MFFRREKPHVFDFNERISNLRTLGFESANDSHGVRVARHGMAANLEDQGEGKVGIGKSGILMGAEIGALVNGGFQMFFRAPSGKELPAQAEHLKALHNFDEDLREGLGLTSLYNTSLGSICQDHLYDRVLDRDAPKLPRPWEKARA